MWLKSFRSDGRALSRHNTTGAERRGTKTLLRDEERLEYVWVLHRVSD